MWEKILENTAWMYWTWQSGLFFIAIFSAIIVLTVWEGLSPNVARKGFLPIPTTRGDRLFIGIISGMIILLLWLAFVGNNHLGWVAAIIAVWFAVQAKWG